MPGSYTADEQSAAKIAGLIADGPTTITAGTVLKVTANTTATVTHGLGQTPDFCIAVKDKSDTLNVAWTADSTTLTFTQTTGTSFTISYIAGYTA